MRRLPVINFRTPDKPYTDYEAATALELEARRCGKSYGKLTADTDW